MLYVKVTLVQIIGVLNLFENRSCWRYMDKARSLKEFFHPRSSSGFHDTKSQIAVSSQLSSLHHLGAWFLNSQRMHNTTRGACLQKDNNVLGHQSMHAFAEDTTVNSCLPILGLLMQDFDCPLTKVTLCVFFRSGGPVSREKDKSILPSVWARNCNSKWLFCLFSY